MNKITVNGFSLKCHNQCPVKPKPCSRSKKDRLQEPSLRTLIVSCLHITTRLNVETLLSRTFTEEVFLSVTTNVQLTKTIFKKQERLTSRTLTEDTHGVMSPLHIATRLNVETLPIITIFRRLLNPTSTISETGPNVI